MSEPAQAMVQADLRVICLECQCGRRWWLRSSEVRFRALEELTGLWRCLGCNSHRVSAVYASAAAVPAAPQAELWATVEVWDDKGGRIERVLARIDGLGIGVAAYERAVQEQPNRNITLRHLARVIRSTERDERERRRNSD